MRKRKSGVYKITNLINGWCYIGQSNNIARRWSEHRNYKNRSNKKKLYQAFEEYGLDNFSFEILEYCEDGKLLEREKYYINFYNSIEKGYNMKNADSYYNNKRISEQTVSEAIDLLKNSNLSQRDIALNLNVSKTFINELNQGFTRKRLGIEYPIRKLDSKEKTRYYCKDCGKEISHQAERCPDCENKRRINTSHINNIVSREELKSLIRTKSFCEIGRMFNISDNGVRKWCIHYKLPRTKKEIKSYSDEDWIKI